MSEEIKDDDQKELLKETTKVNPISQFRSRIDSIDINIKEEGKEHKTIQREFYQLK